MLRRGWIAVLTISIAIVVGCGRKQASNPEGGPVAKAPTLQAGTWAIEDQSAAITVSLAPDGRFQAVFRNASRRSVAKGKAALKDSKIILQVAELDGKPPKSASEKMPAIFKYSPDWSTLTSQEGFVLKRKI
jgi:hypothetical protein